MSPAKKTAVKNTSKEPKDIIAAMTMAVNPAAGPVTLTWESDKKPTTIPPTIPAIILENKGAPEDIVIPKHNGRATKKTTKPEGMSDLICVKKFIFFDIFLI